MEDNERTLLAPNRFDVLIRHVNEADDAATEVFEASDDAELDFRVAKGISNLLQAKGLIEALMKDLSIHWKVANE